MSLTFLSLSLFLSTIFPFSFCFQAKTNSSSVSAERKRQKVWLESGKIAELSAAYETTAQKKNEFHLGNNANASASSPWKSNGESTHTQTHVESNYYLNLVDVSVRFERTEKNAIKKSNRFASAAVVFHIRNTFIVLCDFVNCSPFYLDVLNMCTHLDGIDSTRSNRFQRRLVGNFLHFACNRDETRWKTHSHIRARSEAFHFEL